MDELDERAFRRDKGFLVRIVLSVALALTVGVVGWRLLTDARVGGCVADGFGTVTDQSSRPGSTPSASERPAEP